MTILSFMLYFTVIYALKYLFNDPEYFLLNLNLRKEMIGYNAIFKN